MNFVGNDSELVEANTEETRPKKNDDDVKKELKEEQRQYYR